MKNFLGIVVFFVLLILYSCKEKKYPDALSPEESVRSFQVDERFKIEIFAAEPHVFDPVCMEFDEDGNVYVVEMHDYPFKPDSGMEKGRIRVLKDTNDDGRIDQSIVFADKLSEATSILRWNGGFLVTAAPEILYLKDTTGDFIADTREVLFSGFFKNNPESQITSLKLSVDNWIYANNRGQEGNITFHNSPSAPAISVRGADFRFRLDQNKFEPETGPGQFGQTINDYGHRFFTENTLHINQSVIPWRYTHRHEFMPVQKYAEDISDHELDMFQRTPAPYWRAERTKRRNEEYRTNKLNRVEYESGKFTAATGGTIYTGDGFPGEFFGNVFTGDVAGNLVHRDIISLTDDYYRYVAKRSATEKSKEFLSSDDPWFRPTNFTVGPDGYLYVLDYYRQHIETPFAIPEDLKAGMDFMAGSDKGRIYRIMPKESRYKKINPKLSKTESIKLVELLEHPNQWWRQQAQRLLIERQDRTILPAVKKLFTESKSPAGRLHIIFLLEALGEMDFDILKKALKEKEAGVRENALILAENFKEFQPFIIAATKDTVARVALQAGLSLGNFNSRESAIALSALLLHRGNDKWIRTAVLSAEAAFSTEFLANLVKTSFLKDTSAWTNNFMEDLCYSFAARFDETQMNYLFRVLTQPFIENESSWRRAALTGIIKGLKAGKKTRGTGELIRELDSLKYSSKEEVMQSIKQLKTFIQPYLINT
jgi:putative membrane-bound dehydrogenase-like protein